MVGQGADSAELLGSHLLVGKSVQHRWYIICKTFLKEKTEELIVSFVKSYSLDPW